jgi:hypothetical protein
MPAKRCPMCHSVSDSRDWRCRCGYEFGQDLETLGVLLRDQRFNQRIAFFALLALDLGMAITVAYFASRGFLVYSVFGFVALTAATIRAGRKLLITRSSIKLMAQRQAALPKATVVS